MNKLPAKFVSLSFAMIFVAAAVARAASIREDAEVFGGRDKKVGHIRAGELVTVIAESGDWVKVHYETADDLLEGFVKRDLVDFSGPAPAPVPVADAGATNAAVISRPTITNSQTPPVTTAGGRVVELGLSSQWQVQAGGGGLVAADFAKLLRDVTKPRTNATATQNCVLFKDLYFPMPIGAALKVFNQTAIVPETVNTPGFPGFSFKAYSFDPKMDNLSQLTLVSDTKNQLVAVQTRESGPHALWLSASLLTADHAIAYTTEIKLYDIVRGRTKGNVDWRVGSIAEQIDGVLRIDTELITGGVLYEGTALSARSKERIRLYLPQTLADLCAWILHNRK